MLCRKIYSELDNFHKDRKITEIKLLKYWDITKCLGSKEYLVSQSSKLIPKGSFRHTA
jgi:hypothetical protein